ncbi:MAG: LD-carboxypeptidase [Flavobacteriales bacterium]|nr:LD-carboxypeptidase [Flavobacteriales bacterium]
MTINNMNSISPPNLKKGDCIEIIACAKSISFRDVEDAVSLIEKHGFTVKLNPKNFDKDNVFAGTINQRIKILQDALDNEEVKAIFFARGGYGTIQVIDYLDFTYFSKKPKWLIGFSDITIILTYIKTHFNIQTIHAPMPYNFKSTDDNTLNNLFNLIQGHPQKITAPFFKLNKLGSCKGLVVGGNLSILYSLMGTKDIGGVKDSILFLEDVDEYLYHLERMMYTMDRSGLLKNLRGLIIGQMTGMLDNENSFGKTSYQLIYDIVKKYDYPICFNFPIGHTAHNQPIIVGAEIELDVNKDVSKITYLS